MLYGRSIVYWLLQIVIAVLIFLVVQWLLPVLAGLVGVGIPAQIVTVIALLCALLYIAGGWYWARPGPVA